MSLGGAISDRNASSGNLVARLREVALSDSHSRIAVSFRRLEQWESTMKLRGNK